MARREIQHPAAPWTAEEREVIEKETHVSYYPSIGGVCEAGKFREVWEQCFPMEGRSLSGCEAATESWELLKTMWVFCVMSAYFVLFVANVMGVATGIRRGRGGGMRTAWW